MVTVAALVFASGLVGDGVLSVVVVLVPPDIDVTSVVVTFKNLVVGGIVVVETKGMVALNPFSLERSGAAREEEMGRRKRASIMIFSWRTLSVGILLLFFLAPLALS